MTDETRTSGSPFLAVARFTLREAHKEKGAEFERGFAKYSSAIAEKDGLLCTTLLRAQEQDGRYAILTWWRDQESHGAVIGDLRFFLENNSKFMVLAEFEGVHGPIVSGGGVPDVEQPPDNSVIALNSIVLSDPAISSEFERDLVVFLTGRPGSLAHLLVRSSDDDGRYATVQWWPDVDTFDTARAAAAVAFDAKEATASETDDHGVYVRIAGRAAMATHR